MLPIRDSLQIKRHTQTKRRGMEKDIALMDLEGTVQNEMGQIEKDKYHMISCTCGIKEQNNNNNKSRNKLMDTENILRVTRSEGVRGMEKKGKGIKKYKWIAAE